jgi:hypothetical protein
MDKQLLKAYVRTIVEEEIQKIVPEMLAEAIQEIKQMKGLQTEEVSPQRPVQPIDRTKLAQLMGISYDGETIRAMGGNGMQATPIATHGDPEVVKAINRDYSALMKKMGIT